MPYGTAAYLTALVELPPDTAASRSLAGYRLTHAACLARELQLPLGGSFFKNLSPLHLHSTDLITTTTAMPSRLRSWSTRISLYESSILDSSPFICHRRLRNRTSHPYYDLVFFQLCFYHENEKDFTKWYKIKVCAESYAKVENEIIEIIPLWRGQLPPNASYAALGCNIYCFGGDRSSSSVSSTEVYKLVSNFLVSDERWIQMPSTKVPRIRARILVLDGKIYVVGGITFFLTRSDPRWHEIWHLGVGRDAKQHVGILTRKFEALASFVEVFDPTTGEWKVLPPLPIHFPFESKYTCAALENPVWILIAWLSRIVRALVFCQYYVQQDCWKMLNKLIIDRPLGKKKAVTHADIRYWVKIESTLGKKAVTAGDTLYWLTGDSNLVAYDVV
ncbi:hypothetical protein FH972_016866 [Carpinus fangiana]|uniref:Uncharacterized protein n=1 Tax=Carpinus fangiana TaxID=176857 RepID=A0A5N6RHG3_9ROSI|nr:hypothetical protein FH972_016866 [Carpinus fangiana]